MEVETGSNKAVDQASIASGATVSGTHSDRESAVLGIEQWEAIRQRHGAGETVSRIARELSLDRKTVRRCLRQGQWQPYRRKAGGDAASRRAGDLLKVYGMQGWRPRATCEGLAQRAYLMEPGRIVLQGVSAELLEDPRVREAYLSV